MRYVWWTAGALAAATLLTLLLVLRYGLTAKAVLTSALIMGIVLLAAYYRYKLDH
jgi:hypothetical protein